MARRLACGPWSSRDGWPAPRRRGPSVRRCRRPGGAGPMPSCLPRRAWEHRAHRPRGASGERVAIALPPGLAFAQALHACLLLGAVAVPVDLRLTAARASAARPGRDGASRGAPGRLGALRRGRGPRAPPEPGHDLDATAVVIHTSGTTSAPRPVELTYGNLLWSALGSAVALGLDPRERWLCALPVSHVGGLSILVRSAIYATTAVVHERFDTDRVLDALREQEVTLVSLVATTLARLLDAGLSAPPSLRCALTGGGPVPAALVRAGARAGVPVSLTYGLTEACSQVTTAPSRAAGAEGDAAPARRCSARACASGRRRRDPRRRADRRAGRRSSATAGCTPAISAPSTSTAACTSPGARPTRSSAAARTSRRPRSRRCSRPIRTCSRRRSSGAPMSAGARPSRRSSSPGPAARSTARRCAPTAPRALAPYKVPKRVLLRGEPLPRTRSGKLLRRELR